MNRTEIVTLIAAIIYMAIIYMLVRPGSTGPAIVDSIFATLSDLVRGSIGYTYNSSTGAWTAPS